MSKKTLDEYSHTVQALRLLRSLNDQLNKDIGIVDNREILRRIQQDAELVLSMETKAEEFVARMTKCYLPPDMNRRVGVVQAQLRLQRQRRRDIVGILAKLAEQYKPNCKVVKKQIIDPAIRTAPNNERHALPALAPSSQSQPSSRSEQRQIPDDDFELERHLISQRSKELQQAQGKLLSIRNVVQQSAQLAHAQGEKLDLISDEIADADSNVQAAGAELQIADRLHKKRRSKYVGLGVCILAAVVSALCLLLLW